MNQMNQKTIKDLREFQDRYFEPGYKNTLNDIRLSKANTFAHNLRVSAICCYLLSQEIPYYTEVKLKCGLRCDIVCPTHIIKIIEVLHTETPEKFRKLKLGKLPIELKDEVILISTKEKFNPKSIM